MYNYKHDKLITQFLMDSNSICIMFKAYTTNHYFFVIACYK